jgi:hypothetical protein
MARVQRFSVTCGDATHTLVYQYKRLSRHLTLEIDGEAFRLPKGERQEPFILGGEQAILCIMRDGRANIIVREGEVREE